VTGSCGSVNATRDATVSSSSDKALSVARFWIPAVSATLESCETAPFTPLPTICLARPAAEDHTLSEIFKWMLTMVEPTLDLLQTMVQRVLDNQHRQAEDTKEIMLRLSRIEEGLARTRRDIGSDAETVAHVQARMDRLGDRLDRIERRLDITE